VKPCFEKKTEYILARSRKEDSGKIPNWIEIDYAAENKTHYNNVAEEEKNKLRKAQSEAKKLAFLKKRENIVRKLASKAKEQEEAILASKFKVEAACKILFREGDTWLPFEKAKKIHMLKVDNLLAPKPSPSIKPPRVRMNVKRRLSHTSISSIASLPYIPSMRRATSDPTPLSKMTHYYRGRRVLKSANWIKSISRSDAGEEFQTGGAIRSFAKHENASVEAKLAFYIHTLDNLL